jgi:hypothetical protein
MRGAGPSVGGGVGEICGVAVSCGLVELETAACAKTDAAVTSNEAVIKKHLPIILRISKWIHVNFSGRQDLNLRPRGPKPRALPS